MTDVTPRSRDLPSLEPWHPNAAGDGAPQSGDGIDLSEVISVLRRHRWLVLGITALCTAFAAALVYLERPQYRSDAVVRIHDARRQMTGGLEAQMLERVVTRGSPDPIVSQMQVLRSRAVLGEVVDQEGLRLVSLTRGFGTRMLENRHVSAEAPADTLGLRFDGDRVTVLRGETAIASAPYGTLIDVDGIRFRVAARPAVDRAEVAILHRQRAVDRLAQSLRARQREQTDVVDVEFVAHDPVLAQSILTSALNAFQRFSVERARDQSRRRRTFVEEQLAATDSMLTLAQGALSSFRRREHVYSSQEMFAAQQSGLMSLDVRREELDANRRMYASLLAGVRGRQPGHAAERLQGLVAAPEIAANPVVSSLYTQLLRLEARRDSLTSGPWAHAAVNPDIARLDAQIGATADRIESAVESHLASIDARLAALDGLRARTATELERLPDTEAEEARLALHFETIRRMADQLRDEYQRARISEAVEAGSVDVLDPPTYPLLPVGRGRALKLGLGLLLGLLLGTGTAFVVENLNSSFRSRDEMENLLRLPGLAVIPKLDGSPAVAGMARFLPRFPRALRNGNGHAIASGNGRGRPGPEQGSGSGLVTTTDARSGGSEAFRVLRTNLLFSSAARNLHKLVVTSTAPGEGKTTTAANLAVTYAQQGMRVLLIDCDLRRPRIHEVFGVFREPGLTQLLMGTATADQAIRTTEVANLAVLPAGALPPNPTELLGGDLMRGVLERVGVLYDIVILDTPPVGVGADGAVLAAEADGTIVVVRAGSTDRAAVAHTIQQLNAVGARVLGGVLNDMQGELPKYGGYYGYAYAYDSN